MAELPKEYDFKVIEDKWKKKWEEENLYQFSFKKGVPLFVVDTPLPMFLLTISMLAILCLMLKLNSLSGINE